MDKPLNTQIFGQKIGQCESLEEYETLVAQHQTLYVGWQEYISPLLYEHGLTAAAIAKGCNVSLATARSFSRKIPSRRESVIMLAMMMGFSVEETDALLMRRARFQKLYPKHPHDMIWIYLLRQGGSDCPAQRFEAYKAVYDKRARAYRKNKGKSAALPVQNTVAAQQLVFSHAGAAAPLSAEEDRSFAALVDLLLPSFDAAYEKLQAFIDRQFRSPELAFNQLGLMKESGSREDLPSDDAPGYLFSSSPSFLNRYYSRIRALKEEHRIPNRNFLLALGLRLGMNTDRINEMLELAGMGPLCPKDRLEGTIVFYLEELYCQFPSYFQPAQLPVSGEYAGLMDYDLSAAGQDPDMAGYFHLNQDGLPAEENLADYIRRRLEESNILASSDHEAAAAFLNQL